MIVSNTTPISNFLHLNRIDILRQMFGKIHIPPAVKQEIAVWLKEPPTLDDRLSLLRLCQETLQYLHKTEKYLTPNEYLPFRIHLPPH